jgi:hypothetical protein
MRPRKRRSATDVDASRLLREAKTTPTTHQTAQVPSGRETLIDAVVKAHGGALGSAIDRAVISQAAHQGDPSAARVSQSRRDGLSPPAVIGYANADRLHRRVMVGFDSHDAGRRAGCC